MVRAGLTGRSLWEAVARDISAGEGALWVSQAVEGFPAEERAAAAGWPNPADNGRTPLHLAAIGGAVSALRVLLRESSPGAVDTRDLDLETPLHYAVCFGKAAVLEVLLEHGAEVAALDRNGATPLHMAALWNRTENVSLLLRHHARLDSRDTGGQTPLHWAVTSVLPCEETVRLLVKEGADVGSRTNDGRNALHLAALKDIHFGSLRALLDAGVDIDSKDGEGHTPLYWAARFNARKNLLYLLERGADKTSTDNHGKTAYDLAKSDDVKRMIREAGSIPFPPPPSNTR